MKIIFIGHKKHVETKSSAFFLNIFHDCDIDTVFFDDKDFKMVFKKIKPEMYDLAIMWQYDWLAPYFQSYNVPTVIVPMYDGSWGHEKYHFTNISRARCVNFSNTLKFKLQQPDQEVLNVQFFLNPNNFKQADFNGTLNGFLWQRRPSDINYLKCLQFFNNYKVLDSMTLHLHPDFEPQKSLHIPSDNFCTSNNIKIINGYQENKSIINNTLNNSNIYFAPRLEEGIGMAFLEALTRGMCVIAPNRPTHNEYIVDGINGFLIDDVFHSPYLRYIDNFKLRAKECGERAREQCFIGYEKWLQDIPKIKDFVLSTPKPNRYTSIIYKKASRKLVKSFYRGEKYRLYSRIFYRITEKYRKLFKVT